jgi:nucleoside recognition membrane protein YjiH
VSDNALVVATIVFALVLVVTSIVLVWREKFAWWKMAIVDSVALPLGWFIMATSGPGAGNLAGAGAIFAFILTVPVALVVCLGAYGLRRLSRRGHAH